MWYGRGVVSPFCKGQSNLLIEWYKDFLTNCGKHAYCANVAKNLNTFMLIIVMCKFCTNKLLQKKVNKMVSKSFTILSLSMPIAMSIGTSIAIEFYKNSSKGLLIVSALIGLIGCVYLINQQSDRHRLSYKIYNNFSNQNEQT